MAEAVIMPKQGNTVESCILLEWKKQKGDKINKGDVICEVETDKAVIEVEAQRSGKILDIFFEEGDDIPVMTNIAVIGEEGESYENLKPDILNKEDTDDKIEEEQITQRKATVKPVSKGLSRETLVSAMKGVSPRAKRLAEKQGMDAGQLPGSGPMGRVIERDVISALAGGEPLTPAAKEAVLQGDTLVPTQGSGIGGRVTRRDLTSSFTNDRFKDEKIKGVRKIIAERMLESLQNSAQLTLNSSVDAEALLSLRNVFKNSKSNKRFSTVNINDLLMFAVVKTLPNHAVINSLLLSDTIRYYENIHLGFAVDTPRGLMVATIKNAQNFSLIELSTEIKRLSSACRNNTIKPQELTDATFTVTNLGNYGIDDFTPVLNLPQTAILGIGRINLKPVRKDGDVKFVSHIGLSLTINHQVIDGVAGAMFLQDLAQNIKEINLLIAG